MPNNDGKQYRNELRERFLLNGLESMENEQALTLLLTFAKNTGDVQHIARQLFEYFDSMSAIFNASIEELCKVKDVNENIAILIKMVPALTKMYNIDMMGEKISLKTAEQFGKYFIPRYIGTTSEVAYVLCLNKEYQLISCEMVATGGMSAVTTSSRKIIQLVIKTKAKYVVLSHNHPNGSAIPSQGDLLATSNLYHMLGKINVDLLDHIIVSDGEFISIRNNFEWPLKCYDSNSRL